MNDFNLRVTDKQKYSPTNTQPDKLIDILLLRNDTKSCDISFVVHVLIVSETNAQLFFCDNRNSLLPGFLLNIGLFKGSTTMDSRLRIDRAACVFYGVNYEQENSLVLHPAECPRSSIANVLTKSVEAKNVPARMPSGPSSIVRSHDRIIAFLLTPRQGCSFQQLFFCFRLLFRY